MAATTARAMCRCCRKHLVLAWMRLKVAEDRQPLQRADRVGLCKLAAGLTRIYGSARPAQPVAHAWPLTDSGASV